MNLQERYLQVALMTIDEIEKAFSNELLIEETKYAPIELDTHEVVDCFKRVVKNIRKDVEEALKKVTQ